MSVPRLEEVMPDPLLVCPANAKSWIVVEDFRYQEDSAFVRVPKGFVTDFASIPRFLWQFLPQWGLYGWAAVIHDYLYTSQRMPRWKADRVLLRVMEICRVPRWQRYVIYGAVWFFGCWVWLLHERARKLDVELIESSRKREHGYDLHRRELVNRLKEEQEKSPVKRVIWTSVEIGIVLAVLFADVLSTLLFFQGHNYLIGFSLGVLILAIASTAICFVLERWFIKSKSVTPNHWPEADS